MEVVRTVHSTFHWPGLCSGRGRLPDALIGLTPSLYTNTGSGEEHRHSHKNTEENTVVVIFKPFILRPILGRRSQVPTRNLWPSINDEIIY